MTAATGRFSLPTVSGNADFTIAGIGTPVAVVAIIGGGILDDVQESHARQSIGAATASQSRCFSRISIEPFNTFPNGPSQANRAQHLSRNDRLIDLRRRAAASDAIIAGVEATLVSFITDGVRLNFPTAPPTLELRLTLVFFCGSYQATLSDFDLAAGASSKLSTPFRPSALIGLTAGNGSTDLWSNTLLDHCQMGVGFATNLQPGVEQCGNYHRETDTEASPTEIVAKNSANCLFARIVADGGSGNEIVVDSIEGDGYTLSHTNNSDGAGAFGGCVLALFADSRRVWSGFLESPTSTGNSADTRQGFEPELVLVRQSDLGGTNAFNNGALAAPSGAAAFDASRSSVSNLRFDDNSTSVNARSERSAQAIRTRRDNGALRVSADFVSMDANGFTLNYAAVPGSTKRMPMLVFGRRTRRVPRRHPFVRWSLRFGDPLRRRAELAASIWR